MSVQSNLETLQKKIESACKKSGRSPRDVQLLAVTKKQPLEKIQEAIKWGQKQFGENYVQEWRQKAESLNHEIDWHIIGPLQKNKCKYVVGKVALIQSVDSLSLAEEIHKIALQRNIVQSVLLQINLGDETTKSGASLRDGQELVAEFQKMKGLNLKGLMALPPLFEEAEKSRPYFRQLKECAQSWFSKEKEAFLSMGTSQDFEIAIEEGSHMVRVGTFIFGERE
ncbi:MAG: YggS family pyridoxal phosphate-dependent enzyme [Bdellovibrionales bacterium]